MSDLDPATLKTASELLRAHGLRPIKRLGQNFLCDRNILDRIVRAADLTPDVPVLEIGGGLGALTVALAGVSQNVTTVEIDRNLEPILKEVTAPYPQVHLLFEDFLRLDLKTLLDEAFGEIPGAVVANIPYYITAPLIERLLEHKARFRKIVLLVQQEVARRMVATPGSDACGSFSLFVQYHAQVEIVGTVPPQVFLPPPEVSSAVVALSPVLPATVLVSDEIRFFHLTRAAFGQRRKTLLNALLRAPASFDLGFTMDDRVRAEAFLARAGIDGGRRGETLSLEEFARLANSYSEADSV